MKLGGTPSNHATNPLESITEKLSIFRISIDTMTIALILLSLTLILIFFGRFFDVAWLPTRKKDYDRIAELADLQPNTIFYDLGSGTGEILFYLSKKYNINCIGVEISPILYLYSKIKSLFYKKVNIKYGNFFNQDLSEADVIYVFLHPKAYEKLKKKIFVNLRKDLKIVLSCWPLSNLKSVQVNKKEGEITYYLYNVNKKRHLDKVAL